MYDYNSPYGESCYRLMARTGHFIYLRTRGYLDIDRDTNQVRSFVCHNTLVDEEEGKKLINEMKKKFAIMIQETEFSTSETEMAGVENPEQIVDAVLSLVTDLPENVQTAGSTPQRGDPYDRDQCVTSPPLSIIAPNPSTIKSSITKSVTVIGTAAKCMKYNVRQSVEVKFEADGGGHHDSSEVDRQWCSPNGSMNSTNGCANNKSPVTQEYKDAASICDLQGGIKRAPPSERVPPLPSDGYFDELDYQPPTSSDANLASPLEYKPFDAMQQQYLPTSTTSDGYGLDGGGGGAPMPQNDLKRTHDDNNYNDDPKRRYCASVLYDRSATTLQDACIDDLINPDIGMRLKFHQSKMRI